MSLFVSHAHLGPERIQMIEIESKISYLGFQMDLYPFGLLGDASGDVIM